MGTDRVKTITCKPGVLIAAVLLSAAGTATADGPSPAARRTALLQHAGAGAAAIPALAAALDDENLVVRRTAARLLVDIGTEAQPALIAALENPDAMVRRAALSAVCDPPRPEVMAHLKTAVADEDPFVRLAAVNLLVQLKPRTQQAHDLLEAARRDDSTAVRDVAARAVWPFFKETVSIRDRKDWDHDVRVVQTIPLPLTGWRFATDPKEEGHNQKWYEPGFDDSAWAPIEIARTWEDQGHDYDGVAWYRGSFDLPEEPEHLAVELAFGGVDEVAWVWLNGEYAGQHDLGTAGWDKPFTLDVTGELKWGQSNQITVRVYDSAFAGGIWKPVEIQVLQ